MKTRRWHYKDADREWWRIDLRHTGEKDTGEESVDWEWRYEVSYKDSVIYDGSLVGQYDEVPTLEEVIADYLSHVSVCMLGFVRWGDADINCVKCRN